MSGIEVARKIRSSAPDVAVIALTGHDDPEYPQALQRSGARGFLHKNLSGADIIETVRAVAAGETRLALDRGLGTRRRMLATLTDREYEVLRLLAQGKRNADIASDLVVSPKTIEFHVGHVLDKLAARSRGEAVARARATGLVPD